VWRINSLSLSFFIVVTLCGCLSAETATSHIVDADNSSELRPLLITHANDTLLFEPAFSGKSVSVIADSIITSLVFENYPFASVNSHVTVTDTFHVDFTVDSSVYVDSIEYRFSVDSPLKPWLLQRAIGGKTVVAYDYSHLQQVESILKYQPFIQGVTMSAPLLRSLADSSTVVVPIGVDANRSLFFDGSVVWSSEGDGGLVGYLDIALLNLFWAGEQINFDFYGDDLIQRANLESTIPYLARSPFSLNLKGMMEVGDKEYGYLEGGIGVDYDIWLIWQAGFGFRYFEVTDDEGDQRTFAGIKLSLKRRGREFQYGPFQWDCQLEAGSGVTVESDEKMPRGDFSTAFRFQWPLPQRFALAIAVHGGAIATERKEELHQTEKIRVGGVSTIRGYSENSYAFIGTGYLKNELRYYFPYRGSLFLFGDIGGGVAEEFTIENFRMLFGYGLGIRIPAKKIHFSLIWARHYREPVGPGRIHVGIGN
jgi:outer membrane protein assembly factor BamA